MWGYFCLYTKLASFLYIFCLYYSCDYVERTMFYTHIVKELGKMGLKVLWTFSAERKAYLNQPLTLSNADSNVLS